jgi:hypothetical protein
LKIVGPSDSSSFDISNRKKHDLKSIFEDRFLESTITIFPDAAGKSIVSKKLISSKSAVISNVPPLETIDSFFTLN